MNPLLLMKSSGSLRIELFIVFCVIAFLICMPVVGILYATNISALASTVLYSGPVDTTNTYDYGYCTYWVALLRSQINEPIPNNWGDAITWAIRAEEAGYLVDKTPTYGAIMQDSNAPGGEGHVAFVESVDPITGSWTISEMNRAGWDEVDQRTLPASAAALYNFIHGPIKIGENTP